MISLYQKKSNFYKWLFVFMMISLVPFYSCGKKDVIEEPIVEEEPVEEPEPNNSLKIYIPKEFASSGFESNVNKWAYSRSKQSEHFILFWESGYGDLLPSDSKVPADYRVDIDNLILKAEEFYKLNVDQLKFATKDNNSSKLESYKMMIFLHYTKDWMAYGGGYDDVIGALWISPSTCQPVGATIAHEIGHSFQYQVRCDLGANHGFRYGFGGNDGNGFWEQTAQWQAMQSYPEEIFATHHFPVYLDNHHRHQLHENYRYANYFIHFYWASKHTNQIISKIWRESNKPEDPIQAYMRLTNINAQQLNAEIYDMASKFATWDLNELRARGKDYIGRQTNKFDVLPNGQLRIKYVQCPGTTGFNVIGLEVPQSEQQITVDFEGLVNATGYNTVQNPSRAGWRYGFVALLKSGARVYSPMYEDAKSTVSFLVPNQCEKLFFIVTGAPSTYMPHPWDENENNDDQWPYQIKVSGTEVIGYPNIDNSQEPKDITFTHNLEIPFDAVSYSGVTVQVDQSALAKAFVLHPDAIKSSIGTVIKFYAVEKNGDLNGNNTAQGLGHWFSAEGNVTNWGSSAKVFSEFNKDALLFTIGQYPNQTKVGDTFTIKQKLQYVLNDGQKVSATFVFNIKII
ncbi:DUF4859 domain-containing protein [Sphingobacterium sp. SGL-16]|nr:DUF4859 domain-containing protein [Sphingobacterium sp. SGL-16]